MAVIDVIRKLAKDALLERPGVITVIDGYATEGPTTSLTIKAHSQPLSPQDLRNLPPGQNGSDQRNVWSESELRRKDRITIDGKRLLIGSVKYWVEGAFYSAVGVITEDTL